MDVINLLHTAARAGLARGVARARGNAGGLAYHRPGFNKEKTMFSHVILGVNDLEASKTFYDAVLGALGIKPGMANNNGVVNRYFYRTGTGSFGITHPLNGEPATHGNGSTIGFNTDSPAQADAFHAAGIAHGGTTCEEPPGWRDGSVGKLYLAYLRDPSGNKICALHRPPKA
jgi:catechol 2,3-dioxygenase-like lactoylglutathione lyase family enzyme